MGIAAQNDHCAMPNSPGRGQQADGVGADGEERHEAEVEQARQPERDVEAEAHEDVERDERDDLGHERAQPERQREDEQQQHDAQWDRDDAPLLGAASRAPARAHG